MPELLSFQAIKDIQVSMVSGHAFVTTGVVLAILIVLRWMAIRVINRNVDDNFVRLRYRRTISYLILFIAILLLLPVWLPSIRNVATFLGIFGAGFLIVTRDLWVCIAGWMYILIRRPYVIGDRIQVGSLMGDVIDIRMMETNIMEVSNLETGMATGRVLFFPNSKIFSEVISTTGRQIAHVFQELRIPLTLASDWEKAAKILEAIAIENYEIALTAREQLTSHDDNHDLISGYREPRVLAAAESGKIVLRLQFMAPPGQAQNMCDRIWRSLLKRLGKSRNIKLAPP
jgi:small-conductance mechanosensitive channel